MEFDDDGVEAWTAASAIAEMKNAYRIVTRSERTQAQQWLLLVQIYEKGMMISGVAERPLTLDELALIRLIGRVLPPPLAFDDRGRPLANRRWRVLRRTHKISATELGMSDRKFRRVLKTLWMHALLKNSVGTPNIQPRFVRSVGIKGNTVDEYLCTVSVRSFKLRRSKARQGTAQFCIDEHLTAYRMTAAEEWAWQQVERFVEQHGRTTENYEKALSSLSKSRRCATCRYPMSSALRRNQLHCSEQCRKRGERRKLGAKAP